VISGDRVVEVAREAVRVAVVRQGEDPRLLGGFAFGEAGEGGRWWFSVQLGDGRGHRVELGGLAPAGTEAWADQSVSAFMACAGAAYGQEAVPVLGYAASGLASDGWWVGVGAGVAEAARGWVRRLVNDPHMPASRCDVFIASLDPPKREELLRRAVDGVTAAGF
jgi:hypothetical protein